MKKYIIGFIIGGIICSSLTAIAGSYSAKQISFTPSDNTWVVKNVDDAINSLKTNQFNLNNIKVYKNAVQGNRIPNRSVSITLEKGGYLVFGATSANTLYNHSTPNIVVEDQYPNINHDCIGISTQGLYTNSQNILAAGSKIYDVNHYAVWYCEFDKTKELTISSLDNCCNETNTTSSAIVDAVKIK